MDNFYYGFITGVLSIFLTLIVTGYASTADHEWAKERHENIRIMVEEGEKCFEVGMIPVYRDGFKKFLRCEND